MRECSLTFREWVATVDDGDDDGGDDDDGDVDDGDDDDDVDLILNRLSFFCNIHVCTCFSSVYVAYIPAPNFLFILLFHLTCSCYLSSVTFCHSHPIAICPVIILSNFSSYLLSFFAMLLPFSVLFHLVISFFWCS